MIFSFSTASAIALAACLAALGAVGITPACAVAAEVRIDPHILSAAPFDFHADRGIFSTVKGAPSDSRIFKHPGPPQPLPDDQHMSGVHVKAHTLA